MGTMKTKINKVYISIILLYLIVKNNYVYFKNGISIYNDNIILYFEGKTSWYGYKTEEDIIHIFTANNKYTVKNNIIYILKTLIRDISLIDLKFIKNELTKIE